MASHDTLFTSDPGSASNTAQYVKDVFDDVTLPASNNSGLTSSASTNPLGEPFANDDVPRIGARTLFIKDLVQVDDRSLWVNGKPTYKIIWNENFPAIKGYVFGNFSIGKQNNQPVLNIKTIGDGIGVNGVIRRLSFIVNGSTSGTATGQVVVDGVNGNTVDFSDLASYSNDQFQARFASYAHAATNETKNIHDIRLTALQAGTLNIIGVIAYFENTGANIDVFPGSSYVNKSLVSTSNGATIAVPTYGSSMGGKALVYKTASSGYALSAVSASTVVSIAQGSSGTNLLNVSTGHGSSFPIGAGVVTWNGSTMYVGAVQSVSTDTLTVSPTLTLGVSNTIYRSWLGGQSLAINSSLMQIAWTIDFTKGTGLSNPILDPIGKYAAYGSNIGFTSIDGLYSAAFLGASGYFQVDGRFSAADVEYIGNAIHGATYYVNGLPAWNIQAGQTGSIKKTIFTDAGLGWNSFQITPSASMGIIGIAKINLYQRNRDMGVSYGVLGEIETLQTYTDRGAVNASIMSLGTARRVYADQIMFKGASLWIRAVNANAPGLAQYTGSTTTASLSFQYYGKNFAIVGTAGTGGTLKLDGVGFPNTFSVSQSVATEGFHTISYAVSSTAIIQAIDFSSSLGEIRFLGKTAQQYTKSLGSSYGPSRSEVLVYTGNGHGAVNTKIRRLITAAINVGTGIIYSDDANLGAAFTIAEDGLYFMQFTDAAPVSSAIVGISRNTSQPTTSLQSIIPTDVLVRVIPTDGAGVYSSGSCVTFLKAGDVIRPHTDGQPTDTAAGGTRFHITQIYRF